MINHSFNSRPKHRSVHRRAKTWSEVVASTGALQGRMATVHLIRNLLQIQGTKLSHQALRGAETCLSILLSSRSMKSDLDMARYIDERLAIHQRPLN